MIVSAEEMVIEQLDVIRITEVIGADNVYPGDERVGATIAHACTDAQAWAGRRASSTMLTRAIHAGTR